MIACTARWMMSERGPAVAEPFRPVVARSAAFLPFLAVLALLASVLHPLTRAAAGTTPAPPSALPASCRLEIGPRHTVAGVVDAATLRLDDGSEVRLLGLLAPSAPDPSAPADAWPPEVHARTALAELTVGRDIVLAYAGAHSDRYGRTLAHVLVERDGVSLWVEHELLADGHARAYAPPGGTPCLAELLFAERSARQAARGLWAGANYAPVSAYATGRLWKLRGTYQLVEGWVARIEHTRASVTLQLTAPTRRALRAYIPLSARHRHEAAAFDTLVRRRVRIRGWLQWRNGPSLTVSDPALVEALSAEPPKSGGE